MNESKNFLKTIFYFVKFCRQKVAAGICSCFYTRLAEKVEIYVKTGVLILFLNIPQMFEKLEKMILDSRTPLVASCNPV